MTDQQTTETNATIPIEISPGELLDKITILQIKQKQITDSEKLKNVTVELALLSTSQKKHIPSSDELAILIDSLREINQALWNIEDDIRDCERNKDFSDTFTQLARDVYFTNDKRSEIKKEMNVLLGSSIIEVKSYQAY
jgi:hypothetical protein